jgi:NAD(P)-dependent dehydrogenase (short-subunit alcohol dehydrogenase family)
MAGAAQKSALITGASSGIGRASVARMIESGWRVFATVRKQQDGDRLRSELGPNLTPVIMDVTDRGSILSAADTVGTDLRGAGLGGLVNVAGIGKVSPIEYMSDSELREVFDINLFGQIAVIRAFLPLLRMAPSRIVNVTSVGARLAIPFASLLNGSKSAFAMFSDTLRLELHPFGIYVSAIEPGAIKTPAIDKTLGDIEAVIAKLPPSGAEQYGDLLRTFAARGYEREMHGSSPDVVAHAVHHALTSLRPKARYRVGKHARLLGRLALLPSGVLDMIRFKITGMPSKFGALRSRSTRGTLREA